MYKVGVSGNFGGNKNLINGQTIKTKILTEELKLLIGSDHIKTLDTYNWKKKPFKLLKSSIKLLINYVILFTSDFSHRRKMHISKNIAEQYPYKVQIVHEPGYKKNVSIKRVISHIKFSNNLRKLIKRMEKPDLIYMAYPTMSAAYFNFLKLFFSFSRKMLN